MEEVKYIQFTTEEFILDKEFSAWVLSPDKDRELFWKLFLKQHPEKREQIQNAALIIKSLQPIEPKIPEQRLNEILKVVLAQDKSILVGGYRFLKYAAGIALFMVIGSLIWLSVSTKNKFPVEASNSLIMKGKIIFANGSTREFETKQTTIRQTLSGNLLINNDTVVNKSDKEILAMNQIIIPYGKRSDITLADGSHIWLNSGSQLSYPTAFETKKREVYLTGEALFDVKADPQRPFFVITRNIKIKVLGTSFNVSSYSEDNTIQTVLLRGKISAGLNALFSGSIDLVPGERLVYDKTNKNLLKDLVDVNLYASWINGYLIFDNIPITEVAKKLERYYNKKILTQNGLGKITFSGKLDLKEDLKAVLENISFASSVKLEENNGSFILNH